VSNYSLVLVNQCLKNIDGFPSMSYITIIS